jgi:hypothetical protein
MQERLQLKRRVSDRHHPIALTPQKNPKRWHVFRRQKTAINTPRFTTQSTTTSPQKHNTKTPLFAKTPSKNTLPPRRKKNAARQKPNRILQFYIKPLTRRCE